MAKATKKQRLFIVGPGTNYIGHTKHGKNYWPGGAPFDLDHLSDEEIGRLLDLAAVVEVTDVKEQKPVE